MLCVIVEQLSLRFEKEFLNHIATRLPLGHDLFYQRVFLDHLLDSSVHPYQKHHGARHVGATKAIFSLEFYHHGVPRVQYLHCYQFHQLLQHDQFQYIDHDQSRSFCYQQFVFQSVQHGSVPIQRVPLVLVEHNHRSYVAEMISSIRFS